MNRDTALAKLAFVVLLFTAGACSLLGSGTAPDDMSVEEHRRHSQEEAAKGREHRSRYDSDVQVKAYPGRPWGTERWVSGYDYRYTGDYYWGARSYNPTERHLAHARKHEAHAREHFAAARFLERFEEAQCGSFPLETRTLCPLIGQLASAEDIPGGSRVRFADGVDVNAAVAHLRCHLAFARSQARSGMDSCPLYLEGIHVSRVGQGSEVVFLVEGAIKVKALRKKLRTHVALEAR